MSNQTIDGVPRKLLERAMWSLDNSDGDFGIAAELRALLDAQATWECAPCKFEQPTNRPCDVCGRATTPAAQPQGEPVAYRWRVKGHGEWTASVCKVEFDARVNDDRFVAQALYAEQPAPVVGNVK